MKFSRTVFLCGLAVILIIGFAALPASARDISSGDRAFVYETNVRFTGDLAGVTELRTYNSNHNSVLNTYPVTNPNSFTFLESVFLQNTGTWYAWDGTKDLGYILVRYPELTIDIVLAKDNSYSVQQYGFVETTEYQIKIISPEVGSISPSFASVDIVFQMENGGSSTYASGQNFANIPITSSSFVTNQFFVPKDFSHGRWGIYARWNTPQSFHDFVEDSNIIIMNTGISPTAVPTYTQVPTEVPTEVPTKVPTSAKSPVPFILIPLTVCGAFLLARRFP